MDLVSVIVTVQTEGKQLDRCIKSVLNQAYYEIQLVLVDNGSIAGSGALCDEYAKRDSRIKVVHQKWQTLREARTAGLRVAFGEYVIFLDSRDTLDLYAIPRMHKSLKDSKAQVCICGIKYVNDKNEMLAWEGPRRISLVNGTDEIRNNLLKGSSYWRFEGNKLYWMGLFDDMVAPGGQGLEQDNLLACIADRVEQVVLNYHRLYHYQVEESRPMPVKRGYSKPISGNNRIKMFRTALAQMCWIFVGWITIKLMK